MTSTLSEAASKALLARFGLPVASERVAATAPEAVTAAEGLGYPCVVKLCGDAIAHKTERNLVRLGLASGDQVEQAAVELLSSATAEDGPVELLVAEMIDSNREFIVGAHRSDEFGPVVMIGVGGILAEAIEDVVFRLVPVDDAAIDSMFDDLETRALLGPFRGETAVDCEALRRVVASVARAIEERPDVVAIDVNPVLISNGRPIAVDALVEVA